MVCTYGSMSFIHFNNFEPFLYYDKIKKFYVHLCKKKFHTTNGVYYILKTF